MRKRRWPRWSKLRWRILGGVAVVVLAILLRVLWQQFFLDHSKVVPDFGGIYTEATVGSVYNLNPLAENSTFVDRDIQGLVFGGLLRYNPLTEKIEDHLGTLQVSDRGKTYEVILKDGVKFSDGENIDIADVLFTYETLLQNPNFKNQNLSQAFEYVEIDVVDAHTISFKLPEQNIFFPSLLTLPILPKSYFKNALIEEVLDPDFFFNRRPVGAGPFRVKNIIPEDKRFYRVFLEPNPHYHLGKPFIEQMVFYVYASSEPLIFNHTWPTMFTRLKLGEFDQVEPELYQEYNRYSYKLPRFVGVFFNLDKAIPSQPKFRQALAHALPIASILEEDWQEQRYSFFNNNVQAYPPFFDYSEARRLLRDNGFRYDKQQEVRTFGEADAPAKVQMITSTTPAVYSRFAQKLKNVWEQELDIDIDLEVLEPENFQKTLQERDYDLVLFGQNFSNNFDMLSVWHSSQSGKFNLSNLTRDDIDFLIDEIRFSGAQLDYQALQDELDELLPALIFATPKYDLMVSKKLKGFREHHGIMRGLPHRFTHSEKWHFETKLDWDWPENQSKIAGFFVWLWHGKERTIPEVVEAERPEAVETEISIE